MNTYLLRLCSYHQPRRIRVIENILANRKTVANLFWAKEYGILEWLGARRQATRDQLDFEFRELQEAGLITINEDNEAHLTVKGVSFQENQPPVYEPRFFEWFWLANTKQAFARFLLGFQVISEFSYHNRNYVPIASTYAEQHIVKAWFRRVFSPQLVSQAYSEMELFIGSLDGEDVKLAQAMVNLLIGHDQAGWTPDQLSEQLKLPIGDILVITHDLALAVCAFARATNGPLAQLIKPILQDSPLSSSTIRTMEMYRSGMEIDDIVSRRRLKISTIREHVMTTAILLPDSLDWDRLLPSAIREQLGEKYHGDVSQWQFENWTDDMNADFFYFRLYQIYQGSHENG